VPSARPEDWQQSLLQSVDPQVQKKERIRNFLATFGNTLANTPGNFLQGVAAGAGKGATVYNQQRGEDTDKHSAAQRLIMEFQQSQQDRARGQVKDRYDVGRQVNADRQADDDRIYTRGRQAKADELAAKRVDIAEKRLDRKTATLTPGQELETLRSIETSVREYKDDLMEDAATDEEELAAEDKAEEFRQKQYARFGFDETGRYVGREPAPQLGIIPTPQTVAPGKTSLPGKVMTAPPPANQRVKGQIYPSPNGDMKWMGTGWKLMKAQ